MEDASLTHSHPLCREANAVYAAAISRAIRSGEDARAVFEWTVDRARRGGVGEALLRALTTARESAPASYMDQQGWVLIAFQNAFYQLLHAAGPAEAIADTVARGGDTDTNGAIAGALAGAVDGLRRFPAQWIDRVLSVRPLRGLPGVLKPRPVECWPTDALYLAERLLLVEEA